MNKFGVVFPGQGSQNIGMLTDLAASYSSIEKTFSEASDVLGYDLWQLVQQGPLEELNKTWKTQPALLAASVAVWRIWCQESSQRPAILAGHSLGEYSALVCAEVLSFQQAIALVELRGKLMQEAVPEGTGAMAAIIGLDNESIQQVCEASAQGQVVAPVNFNSPGQVVIAGNREAVERASVAAKDAGAKLIAPLPVSVPSHCVLMKSASVQLAQALENITFSTPQLPVLNNVDVSVESDVGKIRDALVRQLYNPVRWAESIEFMAHQQITQLLEMGPGKVLTGLTKRIDKSLNAIVVNDTGTLNAALGQ